jgi:hypothetical protein
MATIYRPCYATREEVARALDVKLASYQTQRIDRAIQSGANAVDGLCQRKFYFEDDTRSWDWPNYQYAYPWRVWFDKSELADVTVNVPVVVSGGVLIDPTTILWGDPNEPDPPFTYLELSRASSSAFGNGPTPQREIVITGTYGYWTRTTEAGNLTASMAADDTFMMVSDGAVPGVGDVAIVGSERMIVTDSAFVDTTINPISGATTASNADNTIEIPDGTAFSQDEVLLVDSEQMLVQFILGNKLIVKRAWSGSVLAIHSDPQIWARRKMSVLRGQLGTTATTHSSDDLIRTSQPPSLVKDLNIGEAVVRLSGEPSGYAGQGGSTIGISTVSTGVGSSGRGIAREPQPGAGLPMLRQQVLDSFGRNVRSRVV